MRQPSFPVLAGLLLLAGLAAAPSHDVEALLRAGNAAFARGDFGSAIAAYETAEFHSTEPALVAFDLATARYHLALAHPEERAALREAELLYRCCLESSAPRRARALFGLGQCLAQKGESARAGDLLQAIACYDRCLQVAADDAELRSAARQQRELVRLRLLQLLPRQRNADDQPAEDNPSTRPTPPDRQPQGTQPDRGSPFGPDKGNPHGTVGPSKSDPSQAPRATRDPPPPGAGNLPVIPDRADLHAVAPRDAAEHLDQAARRILDDERAHKKGRARPSAAGVRDW